MSVAVLAACSPHNDRVRDTEAVYNAVLFGLNRQIQLHADTSRLSIAVANQTVHDRILKNVQPRRLGGVVLSTPQRAAASDYLRHRAIVQPIHVTIGIPHELVTAQKLSNSELERLFKSGGLVALSGVGFDPSGNVAFVYVAHMCSFGECGSGHFVFLSRVSGSWAITRTSLAWIA